LPDLRIYVPISGKPEIGCADAFFVDVAVPRDFLIESDYFFTDFRPSITLLSVWGLAAIGIGAIGQGPRPGAQQETTWQIG